MVRCEEFYYQWQKKGNFCHKSEETAKKVEEYIDYVKRNKIGGFRISHCALDPFINIEYIKNGRVHYIALHELKWLLKKGKISPEKVTRRVSIELINKANNKVGEELRLNHIPNIRSRMEEFVHEINGIGYEVRNTFDDLKKNIGAKSNNDALKIMLEVCIREPDKIREIKEEMDAKEKLEEKVEIVTVV